MIAQVLNRSFVLDQLEKTRASLETFVSQPATRAISLRPEIDPEDINLTLDLILQSQLEEATRSSGQYGFESLDKVRMEGLPASLDDIAFFSRDPLISVFQSVLEEYLEEREQKHFISIKPPSDPLRPADFAVTNRTLSGLPPSRGTAGLRFLGEFEPTDPVWLSILFAKATQLFSRKRSFNANPSTPLPIPDRSRVLLVGDWGTGLPRAQKVANRIRAVLEDGKANHLDQHVIHLGDVYYAGREREYRNRFLPYWPVRTEEAETITSWSLNGNHDMYSGGYGYYDCLLKDSRFKKQEQSSFFRLFNDHWDILALDTAFDDAGLVDRMGVLKEPQADWVKSIIDQPSGRKTILLSHHQLFSVYDSSDDILKSNPKLSSILRSDRISAWFWGHEHRCMLFNRYGGVQYPCCIGNGGVPVYMAHRLDDPYPAPGRFEYRALIQDDLEKWGLFGFAVLDFNGSQCTVRYIDENGKEFLTEAMEPHVSASASGRGASSVAPLPVDAAIGVSGNINIDVGRGIIVGADMAARDVVSRKLVEVKEGTTISRYPSIALEGIAIPGHQIEVLVNLLFEKPSGLTDPNEITFHDLPKGWTKIPVEVHVASEAIRFEARADAGVITILNGRDSIPCRIAGHVKEGARGQINVVATFFHNSRFCGKAKLAAEVAPAPKAAFARSLGAAAASPLSVQPPEAVGSFKLDLLAKAPMLTVRITQPGGSQSGVQTWSLHVSPVCRNLPNMPGLLSGNIDLGDKPEAFVRTFYKQFGVMERGKHLMLINGFGEALYDRAPQCFKDTYRAIRQAFGAKFPIQFVTDEAYVPWELMRPTGWPTDSLIAESHPVGRWISAYEGWMPGVLPSGKIASIAPDYSHRKINGMPVRLLPQAIEESKMLIKDFHAEEVGGNFADVIGFLQNDPARSIAILHFAGHGSFGEQTAAASRVLLADQDLSVLEVRTAEIKLGAQCKTLVIFNACEVGASGSVLGSIGGWAEAFLRGGFSGFVAPLWSVYDDDACEVVREFFEELVHKRRPAAEALQKIREAHGHQSPTFLSYLYYGDVMAKIVS